MQSLRLKDGESGAALIVKRFALPERFPFDTSDGNFAITNETRIATMGLVSAGSPEQSAGTRAGDRNRERVRDRISPRQRAAQSAYAEENRVREQELLRSTVSQSIVGTDAETRTLSASTYGGSFYVYSYNGRLLAEYNRYDQPVKDYIYIGNRLLAEYKPQESRMYFYTPDQINSTRIVTDDSGAVVYSAAHDPYGGMQKTWVNTYDPTPKFSGKERDGDAESGLDYFGARYYDKGLYRFISVDARRPTILETGGWNLYAYCGNNPIKNLDPDGNSYLVFYDSRLELELYDRNGNLVGRWDASNFGAGGANFPEGTWDYCWNTRYKNRKKNYFDDMSCSGGLVFDIGDNGERGFMVHAGREDESGYGWARVTNGCIRTTEDAMLNIYDLHSSDPLEYIIVIHVQVVTLINTELPPPGSLPFNFELFAPCI